MKMKTTVILFLMSLVAVINTRAEGTNTFKDERERANYAIGLNIGNSFKQQYMEVDAVALLRGITDATSGKEALTIQEAREAYTKYQQSRRVEMANKNKQDGEAFLAANRAKAGVMALPSGLQYKVLTEGKGDKPKPEDMVSVNYRGTLIDGTEFDNSAKTGKPATFRVNGVIPGWTQALTNMNVGSKWQLFVPGPMAYGEQGNPRGGIAPNTLLIFEVELISAQAPPPPPPAPPPPAPLTSDIIKVPSLEEMKKGAKIETIKAEDVEKLQKEAEKQKQQPKSEKP